MTSLPHSARRTVSLSAFALALVLASVLAAPTSQADDANTLTVVGTSDVFDSHLVQSVLEPGFEEAYPQYDLKYVSQGTGAAIAYAEAGNASAMLVHAASLENQFVDQGYSAEPFGRAIFWGDYVLLGPASDPAGVMSDAPNDIASAFEDIAAAGALGQANFVSRGGTPGTTVQEHAIWALTSGVDTCDVSAVSGGGTSPSTTSGACTSPIAYPSWYHATGLTQGPNIIAGDACNFPSDEDNCYVLTDRGTFNYLSSTGAVTNLKIVTRDNDPSARGGAPLLVNSFHAYAINPDKFTATPSVQINLPAAEAFLDWITSPEAQQAVGDFLATETSGDPPFLPSAAPALTSSLLPGQVSADDSLDIDGKLSNVVPGTPALDGVPVRLRGVPLTHPSATPTRLATATTDANGDFHFSYRPKQGYDYSLAVRALTKIENSSLNPVFGDLLAPTSLELGIVKVAPVVALGKVTADGRQVTARGQVSPKVIGDHGRLIVSAQDQAGGDFSVITRRQFDAGSKTYNLSFRLPRGDWNVKVGYQNPHVVIERESPSKPVSVS